MSRLNDTAVRVADIVISATAPGAPIPYILDAEPFQPTDMSSAACPFVIVEGYGGPTGIPVTAGLQFRQQRPNIVLAVARLEANTNLQYGVQDLFNWGDVILSTFAQHVRLSAPPKLIVSASNTNPVTIVTATPHRYTTGTQVTVSGLVNCSAANGVWNVTVIDNWTFTVPVAGNGADSYVGQCVLTQPDDMVDHIVYFVIKEYRIVPYDYGSSKFLALVFPAVCQEAYLTQIRG